MPYRRRTSAGPGRCNAHSELLGWRRWAAPPGHELWHRCSNRIDLPPFSDAHRGGCLAVARGETRVIRSKLVCRVG